MDVKESAGEYAVGDLYSRWGIAQTWVIWRQFLLTSSSLWLSASSLPFVVAVAWPVFSEDPKYVFINCTLGNVFGVFLLKCESLFSLGQKRGITYGFAVAGICGICSSLITTLWVLVPLHLVMAVSLAMAPLFSFHFDEWYHGDGVRHGLMLIGTWGSLTASALAGVKAREAWQAHDQYVRVAVLCWSIVAALIALLVHRYMIDSPLEALFQCSEKQSRLKTELEQHLNLESVHQDRALEALGRFAEATGNEVPEDLKRLKREVYKSGMENVNIA